jgi:hypothetical protein
MGENIAAGFVSMHVHELSEPDGTGSTIQRRVTVEDPAAEDDGTQVTADVSRLADAAAGPRARVVFVPGETVDVDVELNEQLGGVVQRACAMLKGLK